MTSSSPTSTHQADARQGSDAVAHTAVTIEDTFWAPRLQRVRERTLPTMYEQMQLNNYFDAEKRGWKRGMHPIPYVFWETDISKWIEAVSLSLATHPDAQLDTLLDKAIEFLRSIQQPDGYLNIWFTEVEPEKRWSNMRDLHELYCAGHLIEAGVEHFKGTGKRSLLDIVSRYADYLDRTFGVEEGKKRGYSGHPEIELALVKLYRATGEKRYLHLSQYFIDERGKQPHYFDEEAHVRGDDPRDFWAQTYEYNQSHVPIREQKEIVGHAVRAMYLYSAVADLIKEKYDESLFQTSERLWRHLVSKRLYITGGIGSTEKNEGFTQDYDLPNLTAYAESCASIGLIMWNHRLLQLDVDSRYADLLEQALYNGMLSGISLDGSKYFYENPLESKGDHHRVGWFKCACCPPNIARTLMSLGQYVYTVNETDIFTHLYIQGTGELSVNGHNVKVKQETEYPQDGTIGLKITLDEPANFGLNLRIPGWCQASQLSVNGETIEINQLHKGYARIERHWQNGDQVILHLAMPVMRVYAHPDMRENRNRVALQRGPLVYCLESADNAVPLHHIRLPEASTLDSHFEPELLGGVSVIRGPATVVASEDWLETLYQTTPPPSHTHTLTAIPYYAWDHRQPGEMCVWISTP